MAKEETRNKILSAAEKLFSRDGFDGVPTKKIADEAGITEMTLFNHFAKKKMLYKTVVKERYLAIEIKSILAELTYDDLEQDLNKVAEVLIGNFMDNKMILMMRLKEKQSFQDDEVFSLEKDPILTQLLPVFETYEKKGVINGQSEKVALLFMATFKGLCHICLLENKSLEAIKALIQDYVGTFCHGVIK